MSIEPNVTPVARSGMRTAGPQLLTAELAVDIVDDFARRLQHTEAELAALARDLEWLPVKRRGRGQQEHTLLSARLARQRIADCLARHGYERPGARG